MDNNQLNQVLENKKENVYDIYFLLYSRFIDAKDKETQIKNFQAIMVHSQTSEFSREGVPVNISLKLIQEKEDQYFNELFNQIRIIADRNFTSEEFYMQVFNCVFNSSLYPDSMAEKGLLLYILAERIPMLPYYQATDPLMLADNEYQKITNSIQPQLRKAIAMINRNFKTKTEEASQIYNIIQTLNSEAEKIVFLSVIMDLLKKTNIQHLPETGNPKSSNQ